MIDSGSLYQCLSTFIVVQKLGVQADERDLEEQWVTATGWSKKRRNEEPTSFIACCSIRSGFALNRCNSSAQSLGTHFGDLIIALLFVVLLCVVICGGSSCRRQYPVSGIPCRPSVRCEESAAPPHKKPTNLGLRGNA
jgi:hypothetical protein